MKAWVYSASSLALSPRRPHYAMTTKVNSGHPALRSNLINTLFIAPRAQTNIFDLDYQLYLFQLLHQANLNRWTHYFGIALSPLLYYSLGMQSGHLYLV